MSVEFFREYGRGMLEQGMSLSYIAHYFGSNVYKCGTITSMHIISRRHNMELILTEMDLDTMYYMIKEFAIVEMTEVYANGDELVGYMDSRLGSAYINTAFILDKEGWIFTIGVFKDAYCQEAICLMQVLTKIDGSCPVITALDEEQYINCSGIPETTIRKGARRL